MTHLEKYHNINNSFKKTLVFHLGAEAGFYSEFNNMIYAILYCLKYKYKFVLYTKDANFKIEKGWTDFFLPFCDETSNDIHHFINTRVREPKLDKRTKLKFKFYKFCKPNTVLTYQLWPKFFSPEFENETFNIPDLNINGRLKEAAKVIVDLIYRPNKLLNTHYTSSVSRLNLPNEYISINLRRGDKNTEFDYVSTDDFLNAILKLSSDKNIFVFTDDFTVIEELKEKLISHPDYNLYYLVEPNERGYVHSDFMKLTPQQKKGGLLKMFTSVEIMSKSKLAFGSYTNNPGFFLGMRMEEGKFISLQKKEWYQFEMSDVVDVMSTHMKTFLKSINAKL